MIKQMVDSDEPSNKLIGLNLLLSLGETNNNEIIKDFLLAYSKPILVHYGNLLNEFESVTIHNNEFTSKPIKHNEEDLFTVVISCSIKPQNPWIDSTATLIESEYSLKAPWDDENQWSITVLNTIHQLKGEEITRLNVDKLEVRKFQSCIRNIIKRLEGADKE